MDPSRGDHLGARGYTSYVTSGPAGASAFDRRSGSDNCIAFRRPRTPGCRLIRSFCVRLPSFQARAAHAFRTGPHDCSGDTFTTRTSHLASWMTPWLVEPSANERKSPRPRFPMRIMSAPASSA